MPAPNPDTKMKAFGCPGNSAPWEGRSKTSSAEIECTAFETCPQAVDKNQCNAESEDCSEAPVGHRGWSASESEEGLPRALRESRKHFDCAWLSRSRWLASTLDTRVAVRASDRAFHAKADNPSFLQLRSNGILTRCHLRRFQAATSHRPGRHGAWCHFSTQRQAALDELSGDTDEARNLT